MRNLPCSVEDTTLWQPILHGLPMMPTLPSEFSELSCFVPEWVFATEQARNRFRTQQPYSRLQEFYHAVLPQLEAISHYLNKFPLDALPREAGNPLELALMTMEVAPAIEYYQQPDVPDSVDYQKYRIFPVTPRYRVLDSVG